MTTNSELRYDSRDVFKAPRMALSGKYLLAQARPLVYGYICYLVFTYLSLLTEGLSLQNAWSQFSLLPFLNLGLSHWYTKAIWILGIIAAAGFYDYGNLTVGRLAIEEFKGNPFFAIEKARAAAQTDLRPLWVAGGVILLLIAVLSLIQGLIGYVALIPYVGEIIYAILYAVPFVFWSLFVVFLSFGLATAVLTLPAIVVARQRDTFAASFYIFNVIWTRPLRWLAHTVVGVIFAKIGIFIFGYFLMRATQLTAFTSTLFAGEKVQDLLNAALGVFEPARPIVDFFTSLYPGSRIAYDWLTPTAIYQPQPTEYFAALIIAIGMVILWLAIISYGINIITCSQLIAFLHVRYFEDDEKLAVGETENEKQSPPSETPETNQ